MKLKLGIFALCWLVGAMFPHAMWELAWPALTISFALNALFVTVRWFTTERRLSLVKLWLNSYPVIGMSLIVKGLLQRVQWHDLLPLIVTTILHVLVISAGLRSRPLADIEHHARTSNIGRLAKSELQALRYAFSPPRYQPSKNSQAFFLSADVAQMAWMFVMIAAVESFALHLIAVSIGGKFTIMVVILADVFIVYSVGIARSVRSIPIEVRYEDVRIRVGILFDGVVRKDDIIITDSFPADAARKSGCLNGALLSAPNTYIQLRHPVDIAVFALFKKRVDRIKLKLAEPSAFVQAVACQNSRPRTVTVDEVGAAA